MPEAWICSGSSNPVLAKKLAQKLGTKLAEVHLDKFANGEARVWVAEKKVPREAIILQSLSRPADEHLVELMLLADALRRLGASEITAVVPWLGYSQQDKVFRSGEPLSVKVIAKMLQVVPLKRLITFDLHNQAILGFFEIPVTNLSARPLFVDFFKQDLSKDTLVVAPDEGAVKNSRVFAQELGVPVAYVDKKRDLVSGQVTISGLSRSVKGKEILILDDVIVTGSTLLKVAGFLKTQGAASIRVAATHYLDIPGTQAALEKSAINTIAATDTVAPPIKFPKLQILSVADLLVQELS